MRGKKDASQLSGASILVQPILCLTKKKLSKVARMSLSPIYTDGFYIGCACFIFDSTMRVPSYV